MDASMEGLLETYLFETNSLLDGLDELLINAEKIGDFSEDDVNEIFRSMHTIKGSSAMLEFNCLMEIAHHIEDLFFYIRENGIDSLDQTHKSELFNLMFKSTDKLRSEIEKVENNEPLETNIDSFVGEINGLLKKISGEGSDTADAKDGGKDAAPADGAKVSAIPDSAGDIPYFIHVYFEDGCGMENLRAFMIVNALQERELNFTYYPDDIDSNPDSAEKIIEDGFYIGFHLEEDLEKGATVVENSQNIRSYEMVENHEEHAPESPVQEEKTAASVHDTAAPAAASPAKNKSDAVPAKKKDTATHGAVKQDLISVNLSKLDALMALVGEIVIT